ncbi:hypothetical protein BT69DRAFT_940918 [Atractiella rhizophila]|nr:hypothetical protein BT69DRAFT_940918 [Atractiella rhizophila]
MEPFTSELLTSILHPSKLEFKDYQPQLLVGAICFSQSVIWSIRYKRIAPLFGGVGMLGYLCYNASTLRMRERGYQSAYLPPALLGWMMSTAAIMGFRNGMWPKVWLPIGIVGSAWHLQQWLLSREKRRGWGEKREASNIWMGQGEAWVSRGKSEGFGRPVDERYR